MVTLIVETSASKDIPKNNSMAFKYSVSWNFYEVEKLTGNWLENTEYNTNIFLYQHYETRCHLSRHRKTWNLTIVCLVWNAQHVVFRNSFYMFVVVNWDIFRKSFFSGR